MNVSYVVIGSALASMVHWDRASALAVVYLLSVGLTAHSLDAMGPNKPWGGVISRRHLLLLAVTSLVPALTIGAYYALVYAPLLLLVGAVELFFLLAYNLELLGSRFHSKPWFAFSWGFLPVQAGYVLQAGTLDPLSLIGGLFGFATAYAEATASRPYKLLKLALGEGRDKRAVRYERTLQGLVSLVVLVGLLLVFFRIA